MNICIKYPRDNNKELGQFVLQTAQDLKNIIRWMTDYDDNTQVVLRLINNWKDHIVYEFEIIGETKHFKSEESNKAIKEIIREKLLLDEVSVVFSY